MFFKSSFQKRQRIEEKELEADMLKSSLSAMLGDCMGGISEGKIIRHQELSGTLSVLLTC